MKIASGRILPSNTQKVIPYMVDIAPPITAPLGCEGPELAETGLLEHGAEGLYSLALLEIDGQNISQMLKALNMQWSMAKQPDCSYLATSHQILHLSPELIAAEREIETLTNMLQEPTTQSDRSAAALKPLAAAPQVHSSIFSLAKSVYETRTQSREQPREQTHSQLSQNQIATATPLSKSASEQKEIAHRKWDKQDQEGRGGGHSQQDQQRERSHKHQASVSKVSSTDAKPAEAPTESINSIFIRFMALMAKILGQAEAEAHELYSRIKHRTDQIDLLTTLMQKINATNGELDISQNPQIQHLIQRAREIGVEIPEGKTKWTEEEKRLLKENIQMRKDSMEKITQLERTDMQRYLQEASQCHQARSNVLKLLKEVLDTLIHNIRPA